MMPIEKSNCPSCGFLETLRYYKEGVCGDLYYCERESCHKIAIWNGRTVKKTNGEAYPNRERKCIACGCTDSRACAGGCYWVTKDLCSNCVSIINPIAADLAKVINFARKYRFQIKEIALEDNIENLPVEILGIKMTRAWPSIKK